MNWKSPEFGGVIHELDRMININIIPEKNSDTQLLPKFNTPTYLDQGVPNDAKWKLSL
jgi:hypothetical protein